MCVYTYLFASSVYLYLHRERVCVCVCVCLFFVLVTVRVDDTSFSESRSEGQRIPSGATVLREVQRGGLGEARDPLKKGLNIGIVIRSTIRIPHHPPTYTQPCGPRRFPPPQFAVRWHAPTSQTVHNCKENTQL